MTAWMMEIEEVIREMREVKEEIKEQEGELRRKMEETRREFREHERRWIGERGIMRRCDRSLEEKVKVLEKKKLDKGRGEKIGEEKKVERNGKKDRDERKGEKEKKFSNKRISGKRGVEEGGGGGNV